MRQRGLVVGFSIDLGIEPLYDSALALDIGRDFVVDIPSSTRPMTLMTLVPVIGVTRARVTVDIRETVISVIGWHLTNANGQRKRPSGAADH